MNLKTHRAALIILVYYVILASVYAAVTPPLEAPDEASHFLYIHNLLEDRALPRLENRATVFASGSTQRHHPPAYYAVGAALIAWTDRSDSAAYLVTNPYAVLGEDTLNNANAFVHGYPADGQTGLAIAILRTYSIVLGAATLWLIYRAGRLAFPGTPVALLAMLLTASIPNYVFITASINNDNLTTLIYAATVVSILKTWRRETLTDRDGLWFGLLLSIAALSKLNALGAFVVVAIGLLIGIRQDRWPVRSALRVLIVVGVVVAALAGWWYVRNWSLYGDPFALDATQRIWGRGETPSTLSEIGFEASGVWKSFWMVLGNFNIEGPGWLFRYAAFLTLAGFGGGVIIARQRPAQRGTLLLLTSVCAIVFALFVSATTRINVSQGRILFPALVGFALLVMGGWVRLAGPRIAALVILPLALLTLWTPSLYLRTSYAPLRAIMTLPSDAIPLELHTEDLTIRGYRLITRAAASGDPVRLEVYVQGAAPDLQSLYVNAIDPTTQEPIGGVDLFPGMRSPESFDPDTLYAAPVQFRLDSGAADLDNDCADQQLALVMGWRDVGQDRVLPTTDGDGREVTPLLYGPILTRDACTVTPQHELRVTYGERIRLLGYTIEGEIKPNAVLAVTFYWEALSDMNQDWVTAVQVLGPTGTIVAQADGMPASGITSAWQHGMTFLDRREITLPETLSSEDMTLLVGWYDSIDGSRLPARGDAVRDDLLAIPLISPRDQEAR